MTKRFSDRTESILVASGWHEGRLVSVDKIDAEISMRFGLTMLPAVRQFLSEFGGISLAVPRQGITSSSVRFDLFCDSSVIAMPASGVYRVVQLLDLFDDDLRADGQYSRLCNLTKGAVYPIGIDVGDSCILMRSDGAVFSIDCPPTWLSLWGRTGDEAIENACAPVRTGSGIGLNPDLTMLPVAGCDFEKVRSEW